MSARAAALLLGVLAAVAGACDAVPSGPAVGVEWRDRLLFTDFDSAGGQQLSSMKPDGSDVRPVFPSGGSAGRPDLDWRHERLVFSSGNWPRAAIHVWSLAKGTGTTLTAAGDSSWNTSPVWSPDGQQIAYDSNRDGDAEIYLVRPDGSGLKQLTDNDLSDDWNPSWSPDGRRLVFMSNRDGNTEIYVMNADGSGQLNLTNHTASDAISSHAWSPDGSRILFVSDRNSGGSGASSLFSMASDGSGVTVLADTLVPLVDPTWSPDGSQIAFTGSAAPAQFDVFVMNLDGTGLVNLTNDAYLDRLEQWIW